MVKIINVESICNGCAHIIVLYAFNLLTIKNIYDCGTSQIAYYVRDGVASFQYGRR